MMPWLFLRKKCRRITLIKSVSQPRCLASKRGILTLLFPLKRRRSSPSPFISHRVLEAVASWILKSLLSRLEALVWALTFWHGLGWDFLRDSTKPFRWFSDSFTQVTKGKKKRLLQSPINLFAILRFAYTQSRCIPSLVPRALVTLVQRNGKTKTSGKMRLSSAFHWPLTERAQFHRKLINNNFVPRFSILSCARWTCTLWVRSLRARTWRTKQS